MGLITTEIELKMDKNGIKISQKTDWKWIKQMFFSIAYFIL